MDSGAPQRGLDATEKLYEHFNLLLYSLGFESVSLNKIEREDQNVIPERCEKTNQLVSELLVSMKDHLKEIRVCYNTCRQEMLNHGYLLSIDRFKTESQFENVQKSVEYKELLLELQEKNKKLEEAIHQMQDISAIINQLMSCT